MEEQPMMRYQRLGANVTEILAVDSASCLCMHDTFLVLGTSSGTVHVLDLNGNAMRRFQPHSAAVTDLCIDMSGEFVGSCSHDGTVAVSSISGGDAVSTHWYHRPVLAIALDPDYGSRKTFATGGLAGQLVLSSRGWFGSRDTILHAGEGPVRAISCCGPMLAWANDVGVKVYDSVYNRRVSYIERDEDAAGADNLRCHLCWEGPAELIIGWATTIKIARVRTRDVVPRAASTAVALTGGSAALNLVANAAVAGAGTKYMEITAVIRTDYFIAGLRGVALRTLNGVRQPDLLVLAYMCEPEDEERYGAGAAAPGGAQRPELRLISRNNEEFFSDALSMSGYEELRCSDYALVLPPSTAGAAASKASAPASNGLTSSVSNSAMSSASSTRSLSSACLSSLAPEAAEEAAAEAPQLTAYIVSPRDIVVARSLDWDDRISWLVQRQRFDAALAIAKQHQRRLARHHLIDVAELYVAHLLNAGGDREYAARLCGEHLGGDSERWARWVSAFSAAGALPQLLPQMPTSTPQLAEEVYEAALQYLVAARAGGELLSTLRRWPPRVYRVGRILETVRGQLNAFAETKGGDERWSLLEALAALYCHTSQHEAALEVMLQLPAGRVDDLFAFIEQHSLQAHLVDKVGRLVSHSWQHTVLLLLQHVETMAPAKVVPQLDASPKLLHEYLHRLFDIDPTVGAEFHTRQLQLYASLAPEHLLYFLRNSSYYSLEEALRLCEAHGLVECHIFVLSRMGSHRKALQLILEEQRDMSEALRYVQEVGDNELWQQLLDHSMSSSSLAVSLLQHICAEPFLAIEPAHLVRMLPLGMPIPGLKGFLVKLLAQAAGHVQLTQCCVDAALSDRSSLAQERHQLQCKGTILGTSFAGIDGNEPASPAGTRSVAPPRVHAEAKAASANEGPAVVWHGADTASLIPSAHPPP